MNLETQKSLGFCFVEFRTKESAHEAVDRAQGYKLDKKHIFRITHMVDFDKIMATPETWEAPADAEFEEKENLHSWLLNPYCEDQFVVRHGLDTEVQWCRKESNAMVEKREKWTDAHPQAPVAWSPQGTYLATFHRQGICLWGGKKWARVARFAHSAVKLIEISPCEKFLVTWSSDAATSITDPQTFIFWDIKSGEKLRGFGAEGEIAWPVFKWSCDDQYFARIKMDEAISVYSTPGMELLQDPADGKKKSIKLPGVKDFAWSPTDNVLTYWTPEEGERPARLCVLEIPSRKELASKNLYMVKECKLLWQKNGDHLCVCVERWVKSKKATYNQFMIFHMREKLIPCDILEMKDKIEHFAWEPIGTKFAIIHGEGTGRMDCTIHDMIDGKLAAVKVYERVDANALFWSPRGRHLCIAGMGMSGIFQFVDTEDHDAKEMGQGTHINAGECNWDPTGRYVITTVSAWQGIQHDTGYMVWSFQGKPLQRENIPAFYQLMWRPRPKSLLQEKDLAEMQKNYKTFQSQFEAEDKLQQDRASTEVLAKRMALLTEWEDFEDQALYHKSKRQAKLESLRPPMAEEMEEVSEVDEIFEVFVSEEVTILEKL